MIEVKVAIKLKKNCEKFGYVEKSCTFAPASEQRGTRQAVFEKIT
jgi:hypothetical protein